MTLASERGASNWLTTLPIEEFGFTLHKGAFHDALALRYGWKLNRTPSNCSCGSSFSVNMLSRAGKVDSPITRHITANLLTEVYHEVNIEPDLQPVTGETFQEASAITQDGA